MKTKKKRLLQVGERIVIATKNHFHKTERADDYEVVRANGSSAYVVRVENLDKKDPYEIRIEQKTHRVIRFVASFDSQVVYDSREQYETLKARREKLHETRSSVIALVSSLKQSQLDEILSTYGQLTPTNTN